MMGPCRSREYPRIGPPQNKTPLSSNRPKKMRHRCYFFPIRITEFLKLGKFHPRGGLQPASTCVSASSSSGAAGALCRWSTAIWVGLARCRRLEPNKYSAFFFVKRVQGLSFLEELASKFLLAELRTSWILIIARCFVKCADVVGTPQIIHRLS